MTDLVIKPALVTNIRNELAKEFPALRNIPVAHTLEIPTLTSGTLEANDSDIYHFTLPPPPGRSWPALDIAVFKQPCGRNLNWFKPEDIINYPVLAEGDPDAPAKRARSVQNACVIVVQCPNGIIPFSRMYVFDGLRHRKVGWSFANAATFGAFDLDYASPEIIAKKLVECIGRYSDLEERFTRSVDNAHKILQGMKKNLDAKNGYAVTRNNYYTTGRLELEIGVKRTGLAGKVRDKFGIASGAYQINSQILGHPYLSLLEYGDIKKEDVLNLGDLEKRLQKLKGEPATNFDDAMKASPVVEFAQRNSTGHFFKKYVILMDHHLAKPPERAFTQALASTMKYVGPTSPL